MIKKYNQLIEKAKSEGRKKGLGIYYEKHHIVPKCIGGKNNKNNLVLLTATEHFDAHYCLCYIHKKDKRKYFKMLTSFMFMMNENIYRDKDLKWLETVWKKYRKTFSKLREEYSKLCSKNCSGKGNGMYGRKHKKSSISKMSKNKKGNPAWNKGKTDIYSEETKKRISETLKGRKKPISAIKKQKKSMKNRVRINKEGKEKNIKKGELKNYIDLGWGIGGAKWSDERKEKWKVVVKNRKKR